MHFDLLVKKTIRLPDIQRQQEFDEILRKRYRKVALRFYLKLKWIVRGRQQNMDIWAMKTKLQRH